ncbi:hypothetical protein [Chitinimonas koreensis]|uniref:hypothetical protein n=1 Tax=Chitinimonas koreensis TaxID=356302 RepID=UPI000426C0E0|nr:hypothetical protein [Chitinimonas koreensis]
MHASDKRGLLVGAALFLFCSAPAQADGLADLKAALNRLQGQSPIKAVAEVKTWRKQGEGQDADERQGQASFAVEDGARGLQLLYGKDLLARAEAESRASGKDKKARTPTLYALRELDAVELRGMTSAATGLARAIEEAVFKGEVADSYGGKPARKLSFEIPIDMLGERERKYVKKFDTRLEVWIGADGTPLASRRHQDLSGRAFVVVGFEQRSDEERSYQVAGDRLLLVRKEERGSASGAGEREDFKLSKALQLQP